MDIKRDIECKRKITRMLKKLMRLKRRISDVERLDFRSYWTKSDLQSETLYILSNKGGVRFSSNLVFEILTNLPPAMRIFEGDDFIGVFIDNVMGKIMETVRSRKIIRKKHMPKIINLIDKEAERCITDLKAYNKKIKGIFTAEDLELHPNSEEYRKNARYYKHIKTFFEKTKRKSNSESIKIWST